MRLLSLAIEHFRSYERLSLQFSDAAEQMFMGENGAGKTNIIEAISFLSMGRSCLHVQSEDALRWGEDFFRISAETISDDQTVQKIEYVWQRSPRRQSAMFVRDIRTPLLQFIGVVPTIIFLPQHLDLFTGPPGERRAFLDALLSQLKPTFAASRLEYEHILKQRNAVITRVADGLSGLEELSLWDSRLARAAAELTLDREEVVGLFNQNISSIVSSLGEKHWSEIQMVYQRKTHEMSVEGIEQEMLQLLSDVQSRDLALRVTTVGPHREDWSLRAQGHSIAVFASRGQQRAAFLALLLSSADHFTVVRHERPVILLDDVFSELDDRHQSSLLSSLSQHQVCITTTHSLACTEATSLWKVQGGQVERSLLPSL